MKGSREKSYEDFYNRAITNANVEEILKEGGGTSFPEFKKTSRGKTTNADYWKSMFNHPKARQKLGKQIYKRYIKDDFVTRNASNRLIVRTGQQKIFGGKTYKGGMFLPRSYFEK